MGTWVIVQMFHISGQPLAVVQAQLKNDRSSRRKDASCPRPVRSQCRPMLRPALCLADAREALHVQCPA